MGAKWENHGAKDAPMFPPMKSQTAFFPLQSCGQDGQHHDQCPAELAPQLKAGVLNPMVMNGTLTKLYQSMVVIAFT